MKISLKQTVYAAIIDKYFPCFFFNSIIVSSTMRMLVLRFPISILRGRITDRSFVPLIPKSYNIWLLPIKTHHVADKTSASLHPKEILRRTNSFPRRKSCQRFLFTTSYTIDTYLEYTCLHDHFGWSTKRQIFSNID